MTRKVRPRQSWRPETAADHNAKAAAADSYRRGPDGVPDRQLPINANVVTVKNSTGAAKRQYEVVALTRTPILTAVTREQVYVYGQGLSAGGMPKTFAVFLEPVANAKYAPAQVAGICPALVYVNAVTDHFCDLPAGEDRFVSSETGPVPIIQQPNATGEQLCIVNLSVQEESHLVGIPTGDGITARNVSSPGTGTVQLYYLDNGGLVALSEGGNPVYQTVYSLSDDPIIPFGLTPYSTGQEYYLLHCDVFGTWWIAPHERPMLSKFGAYLDGQLRTPSGGGYSDSGYLTGEGYDELDNTIVNLGAGSFENSCALISLTGDYTVTMDWGGGGMNRVGASSPTLWYQVTVRLWYYPPGGPWADLFEKNTTTTGALPAGNTVTRVLPTNAIYGTTADGNGRSNTTVIRLEAATYLRISVSVARLDVIDTLVFSNFPDYLRARVTLQKHV